MYVFHFLLCLSYKLFQLENIWQGEHKSSGETTLGYGACNVVYKSVNRHKHMRI